MLCVLPHALRTTPGLQVANALAAQPVRLARVIGSVRKAAQAPLHCRDPGLRALPPADLEQ